MPTENNATTVRFTADDKALIAELKESFGIRSTTELVRVALRQLARSVSVKDTIGTQGRSDRHETGASDNNNTAP